MSYNKSKKIILFIFILTALFSTVKVWAFFSTPTREITLENSLKTIFLDDDGLNFKLSSNAITVAELLKENRLILGEHDEITPEKNDIVQSGTHIKIQRATKIKIIADGKTIENYALGKTVDSALRENNITLSRLDKTNPPANSVLQKDILITVTRINIEEVTKKEDVAFKTEIKNDAKLGWQEKKIDTPGKLGEKEVKYRITYKNGKEISRLILHSEITAPSETQIEIHGTYMKLGKANSGQGTWYSYQGGMFAASTTIPKGAYAKVTNLENGKSIVVQINDYGPQGKGRVIDLDKVAFQKIASIGAGVIGVKVEPVLN